jgi:hypothetical protein
MIGTVEHACNLTERALFHVVSIDALNQACCGPATCFGMLEGE